MKKTVKRKEAEMVEDEADIAPSIKSCWVQLDTWLAFHSPKVAASLLPGATAAQLDELENSIGRKLPLDFREFYMIHNGQDVAKLEGEGDALFPRGVVLRALQECKTASGGKGPSEDGARGSPEEPAKEGKVGEQSPFSAFVSFASAPGETRGLMLTFVKDSSQCVVVPWNSQDALSMPSPPSDFGAWFSRFVNSTVNPTSEDPSNKLVGLHCMMTGLFSVSHEALTQTIERHGGMVSQRVSGLTTHMLLGETGRVGMYNTLTGKGSKKYKEASRKKKVKRITEEQLRAVIAGTACLP